MSYNRFGLRDFMLKDFYLGKLWHIERPSDDLLKYSLQTHSLEIRCSGDGVDFSACRNRIDGILTCKINYEDLLSVDKINLAV